MNSQPNTIQLLEFFLHLAFWALFLAIFVFVFNRVMSFHISVLRAVLNILPIVFLFYVNAILLVNRLLEKRRYLPYLLWVAVLLVGITLMRSGINQFFPIHDPAFRQLSEPSYFIGGALITNIGFLSVSTFYQLIKNHYQRGQRTVKLLSERNEAELRFLKAQINPHFLFNTLNNIYSLAVIRSEQTADMVLQLSNILRYVIYESLEKQVRLEREVEHIQKLIDLFKMRSEESPDIQFIVTGATEKVVVEPMILIPLVENCFKHCDFDTSGHAFVEIKLDTSKNKLVFKTKNSKNQSDKQKDKTGGVGLANIRKRLELLYPNRFSLEIQNKEKEFEVTLTIDLTHANYPNPTR